MKNVICIGSALKDIFLPSGDGVVTETPDDPVSPRKITFGLGAKYRIENRYTSAGGGALNSAVGLSRLGVQASPYALIGGDATGMWLRDVLVKNHVDTAMIRQVSEAQTDLSTIVVDRKTGERVIFVNRDLQETLHVDSSMISGDAVVFVSALSGQWRENYQAIIRATKECGCHVAYNPGQSNITEDVDAVYEMLAHAGYVFVNKDEAAQIVMAREHDAAQIEDVHYLMAQLAAQGPQTVVVTAGLAGAWMRHKNKEYFVPSSGTKPVDATGAGDAFTSGVLAALLHGESPQHACAWGAANAASVVGYYGSNEGLLSLKAVRAQAEILLPRVEVL